MINNLLQHQMPLKRVIIVFLTVFLFYDAHSQIADLMRNKNITWAAESYNDFQSQKQTQCDRTI